MADAIHTGYGIKLHWGPPTPAGETRNAIGFSEKAYKRWRDHVPVGTRMLLYSTSTKGGTKEIHAEVAVTGTFEKDEDVVPHNEEHPRMLRVKPMHALGSVRPVPLKRVREILGKPNWPHEGQSWYPVSKEVYETLRAELLRSGERKTT